MRFVDDQAASNITLWDGTIYTKCDQCREMWTDRNLRGIKGEPPCDECKVILDHDNNQAAEVYMLCRGQVIFRHNGQYDIPHDLNFLSFYETMDRVGIERTEQMEILRRVRKLFFALQQGINEDEQD